MITVTEKAAKRIRELLEKEGIPADVGGLRLGVQGGGCSGLTYAMRLEKQPRPSDKVFVQDNIRVFVDPKSYLYLAGTVLDFKDDLMQQGFVFQNPNASKSCGCGTSFSA